MNLLQIETFLEVAKAGSFAAASRRMSLPSSTVSARIKALEDRLGVTLFRRTTRKVALTSDGQHHFEIYNEAFELISSLEARSVRSEDLTGHIRLTVPVDFSMPRLARMLGNFSNLHPSLKLDIIVTDAVLDFVDHNIDIALRGRAPGTDSLICRQLGQEKLGFFASPDYIAKRGAKLMEANFEGCTLFDPFLQAHKCGDLTKKSVPSMLQTESKELSKAMAVQSRGIALLAQSLCENEVQSGELVELPCEGTLPDLPLYLVMPSKRLVPQRVRALIDHLVKQNRIEPHDPAKEAME